MKNKYLCAQHTLNCKGKGKVHPRTGHEGPEGEKYSSTLPSTSTLGGVGGQRHAPAALPPVKTRYPLYKRLSEPLGAHSASYTRGAENLAPTGISSLDRPARSKLLYRLLHPGPRTLNCNYGVK